MLAESKAALAREAAARRKLHNLVQELRGNIRVFVRVKPADARARGASVLACEDGHRIACTAAGATKARRRPRTVSQLPLALNKAPPSWPARTGTASPAPPPARRMHADALEQSLDLPSFLLYDLRRPCSGAQGRPPHRLHRCRRHQGMLTP